MTITTGSGCTQSDNTAMRPYGDAITHELIPHTGDQFWDIGEGWGWTRFLCGGSARGWETLTAQ